MALPILDGNQSATTLSTILSSGQHITAHTVVSLGTQAITDMRGAVSGSVVSISNLPATQTIAGTVTAGNLPIYNETDTISDGNVVGSIVFNVNGANAFGTNGVTVGSIPSLPAGTNRIGVVTIGNTVTIAGTVTVGVLPDLTTSTDFEQAGTQIAAGIVNYGSIPVAINSALPAGTAQIGSVTASISGTVPVSGTFFQATQPVSLTTLPALVAGTAQIGSVTASISNSVTIASLPAISGTVTANTFALQGTAVTTSNFTSTTASTVLASFNATREVLTIFNEGAGLLFVCPGALCTTTAYQVRLSAGDYYEVPNHQTTITHSAVFATAGTARVTEVS